MIDILGAVYDFVLAYAWRDDDCPQLKPDQIVRGWQNSGTLPRQTSEFCVLTLRQSVTHGKPIARRKVTDDDYHRAITKLVDHTVQVDFCSAEPFVLPQVTKLRADLLDAVAYSPEAVEFFQGISPNLNCNYGDGVTDLSYFDGDKLYTARYMVTLHLSEIQNSQLYLKPSFNRLKIWTVDGPVENVIEHHPIDKFRED